MCVRINRIISNRTPNLIHVQFAARRAVWLWCKHDKMSSMAPHVAFRIVDRGRNLCVPAEQYCRWRGGSFPSSSVSLSLIGNRIMLRRVSANNMQLFGNRDFSAAVAINQMQRGSRYCFASVRTRMCIDNIHNSVRETFPTCKCEWV